MFLDVTLFVSERDIFAERIERIAPVNGSGDFGCQLVPMTVSIA
jgi:hypothetical protein